LCRPTKHLSHVRDVAACGCAVPNCGGCAAKAVSAGALSSSIPGIPELRPGHAPAVRVLAAGPKLPDSAPFGHSGLGRAQLRGLFKPDKVPGLCGAGCLVHCRASRLVYCWASRKMRSASFGAKVVPLTPALSECGVYLIPYLLSNALLVAFYLAAGASTFAPSGGFLTLLVANSCGIPISVLFFAKLGLLWKLGLALGPLFAFGGLLAIFNFWVASLRFLISAAQIAPPLRASARCGAFAADSFFLLVTAVFVVVGYVTLDLALVATLVV
jgi:hypothetical protein